MPREARLTIPGVTYHVIWRFVDRDWFFTDDEERELYLRLLGHSIKNSDWTCLGYALMSSHGHLALVAGYTTMSSVLRPIHSPFANWMNRRHGRLGPLISARPKSYAFLPHNEGRLLAYVHNNPVAANVVPRARDSTWTSHRAYVGLATPPPWLDVRLGLERAGFDDPALFDAWVDSTPGERWDPDLEKHRKLARRRGSLEVATPVMDGDRAMMPLVGRLSSHVRPPPRRVVEIVAELTRQRLAEVCSRLRHPDLVAARAIASQCARRVGVTKSELAVVLGISSQAVHKLGLRPLGEVETRVLAHAIERLEIEQWGAGNQAKLKASPIDSRSSTG